MSCVVLPGEVPSSLPAEEELLRKEDARAQGRRGRQEVVSGPWQAEEGVREEGWGPLSLE